MLRSLTIFLLAAAVAAPDATAQPSADAVVAAWSSRQADAVRGVVRVEADEAVSRRIDGPRGTVRVETRGTLTLGPDGRRTVASARVDGQEIAPERVAALEARLGRAFGPGFGEASAAPRLVPPVFSRGAAAHLAPADLDGRPTWRVSFAAPAGRSRPPHRRGGRRGPDRVGGHADRADAWFTRSAAAPRLLRIEVEGARRGGGRFRRTVTYTALGALDVPATASAELGVTQQRRLRRYTTSVTVEARYQRHRVVRP